MNPLGPQGGKVIFKLSPNHCDKYKDKSSEDIINPTHLPDCWDRFIYNSNGFIKGEDEVAIKTITVLNLNAKTLVEKRANVWAGLEEMFKEDPEISNYYLENDIAGLKNFIEAKLENEVKSNRPSHFCNVYRAFLKYESAKILKR
jgi:hypothetical protein